MNHKYDKEIARIVVWSLILFFALRLYYVYAEHFSLILKIVIIVVSILVLWYIIAESIILYRLIFNPLGYLKKIKLKEDEPNEPQNNNHMEKDTIMDNNDKKESSSEVKVISLEAENLASVIRVVVQKWGVDYLKDRILLNILNDYQVFKDIPAAKHILQNMQANGYIERIIAISNWELESKNIVTKYANEFGAKEDLLTYIVACVGYGIQYINDRPELTPKIENSRIDNTNSSITTPPNSVKVETSDPSLPYDPKKDLPNYQYPDPYLLQMDSKPFIDMNEQNAKKNHIVDVLRSYGVEITMIKATVGPTITLYEITLAPGVLISTVRNRVDDIILSLGTPNTRLIIPMPGRGTIGIEIMNTTRSTLSMYSIINSRKYQETTMVLPCAIGKTSTNEVFMFDLENAPHLLIAGATGQGKSICMHAIIASLLYKKHPSELKLVLIDTKRLEFNLYSGIGKHFLAKIPDDDTEPIISDVTKVIRTLNSLCKEMDTRYDLLKIAQARNIKEYNKKFIDGQLNPKHGHRFMPYIVVVIDEFGDLIMSAGKKVELSIARIAHQARVVGIHMVIATQRPTANIITGTIKANIPCRIAFRVSSAQDSRIILDRPDAKQLLGNGDMLYQNIGDPIRVQGAFINTSEVEQISQFISKQQGYNSIYELPDPDYEEYVAPDVDMQHLDPLFEDAARHIVREQSGSTSLIQRKFVIGYNRAGRLMDQLEKAGIVGEAHGSKPRDVLVMDMQSLEKILKAWR